MKRVNCWEFKKCGRELAGDKAADLGICPASMNTTLDGVHSGICAGRACWAVAGTMCGGEIQGPLPRNIRTAGYAIL